jgi:hypothetical protein
MIEVLHQLKDGKFKQLFVIQFNTFFVGDNMLRFTKDKIDGVCKDIRYPDEFFIDLIFDEELNKSISMYESDVSKWKSIISDFVLKSFKTTEKEEKIAEQIPEKSDIKAIASSSSEIEEDITAKPNTINKAEEILQKFSADKEDEENEDDMEDYLKSLENK